jgi:hypothetical protein
MNPQRKKVIGVTIEFEDGTREMYWPIDGLFRAYAEWEEYMVTWILPIGVSKEEN